MIMKNFMLHGMIGIGCFILSACTPTPSTTLEVTPPTPAITPATAVPSITPAPTIAATQEETQEPASFLLSEPGTYFAGNREYTLIDDSRNGREVKLLIWYPAQMQINADGNPIVRDAPADMSGAPYPIIITEENSGRYFFLSHLATHGFVMVAVRNHTYNYDPSSYVESATIENVRDFLFALDRISSEPPSGLEGMLDTDTVGVTGYSYGGDIALTMSGARIDLEFYRSQCAQIPAMVPEQSQWVYSDYMCLDANWENFEAYMGGDITTSNDGLWQPLTDERIRAVMPMAPTVSWYFGERGLAAVDRPVLLIWGTEDVDSSYSIEAGYTFDHLVNADRYLISFIGYTHTMLPESEKGTAQIKHFATAYFGYYLQDHPEYAEYFSEDFVSQFADLFCWGVCSGEK
jgi:predicted dienelactone hydrolase